MEILEGDEEKAVYDALAERLKNRPTGGYGGGDRRGGDRGGYNDRRGGDDRRGGY